jgi:hypothetical protein
MRRAGCLAAAVPSPIVVGFNRCYGHARLLCSDAANLGRAHVQAQLGQPQKNYWKGRVACTPQPPDNYNRVLAGVCPRRLVLRCPSPYYWPTTRSGVSNGGKSSGVTDGGKPSDVTDGRNPVDMFPVHLMSPHLKELTVQISDLDSGSTQQSTLDANLLGCVGLAALTVTLVKSGPYNCGLMFLNGLVDAIGGLSPKHLPSLTKLDISDCSGYTIRRVAANWPHLAELSCSVKALEVRDVARFHHLTTLSVYFPPYRSGRSFELNMAQMITSPLTRLTLTFTGPVFNERPLIRNPGVLTSLTELNLRHLSNQQSCNAFVQQLKCLAPVANTLTRLTLNLGDRSLHANLVSCGLEALTKLETLVLQNVKMGAQYVTLDNVPVDERNSKTYRRYDQCNFDALTTLPALTTYI